MNHDIDIGIPDLCPYPFLLLPARGLGESLLAANEKACDECKKSE